MKTFIIAILFSTACGAQSIAYSNVPRASISISTIGDSAIHQEKRSLALAKIKDEVLKLNKQIIEARCTEPMKRDYIRSRYEGGPGFESECYALFL